MSDQIIEPTERVFWQRDLAAFFNIDRVTAYRWDRSGKLPSPDVVMGRRRGWYASTLRTFAKQTLGRTNA